MQGAFGPAQKIFYIHLPIAIFMFIAAFSLFIASVGYLWTHEHEWDDLALAAGEVTVLCCTIVLLTGVLWGKSEWGQWWTWSPRLTNSLVLWVIYVAYLIVRQRIHMPSQRAAVSAVYGLAAFIDVPLVYVTAKLMPDIHPRSMQLDTTMKMTLLLWMIPIFMMMGGLINTRFRLNTRLRERGSVQSVQSRHDPLSTLRGIVL